MILALDLHGIAQYSALRIVDSLTEGTFIGLFAAALLRFTRRQNAGTRFAIWFSALIAIAASPLIGSMLPSHAVISINVRPAVTVPDSWALYIFGIWAISASWVLVGVGRALWRLHLLRKSCTRIDPATLDPMLRETLCRTEIKRLVDVCTSNQVRVPTAIGLTKPAIVLPDWAMRELSPSELKQIFLHELAHLRRWDDWTNLVQQVVRAVFFFHPAVWWIENKAALEREMACDDAVLAETASPRAYAECLAHLAERSFLQRSIALAQAALGRIRQTSARVAQILDVNRPAGKTGTWKPAAALVAGFAIACGLSASSAPQLIAFRDSQPIHEVHSGSMDNQNAAITPPQEFPQAVPVTPAKLNVRPMNRAARIPEKAVAHAAISKQKAGSLVHLANTKSAPAPFAETVVVFIQGTNHGSADSQVYQIQMWRVTLLRYIVEPPSDKAPRKTT